MATKIEWTDSTTNPGVYGCSKVSEACEHCYAMRIAHRGMTPEYRRYRGQATRLGATGGEWTGRVFVEPRRIATAFASLPKKKPHRCFVTSMADLFHADVPDAFLDDVFREMRARPHVSFQVLTKRPERVAPWFAGYKARGADAWPRNVWMGATVENQRRANERLPHVVSVAAPVRFLSVEPLLGPIDLRPWLDRLHWVIGGGESGGFARPMNPQWVRDLRDQCAAANVPFFFKQWGEWAPCTGEIRDKKVDVDEATGCCRVGKKKAGRLLDGREHSAFPA